MALSFDDAARLKEAGFLDYEIEKIAAAETVDGKGQPPVDLSSPVWQRTLESRRAWVDDKVNKGWSQEEIERNIMDYYARGARRNPWDFIKAEYKPIKKRDFWIEIRERNKRKIKATLRDYF